MRNGFIILVVFSIISCKSAKNKRVVTKRPEKEIILNEDTNPLIKKIIENAEDYQGVRYKYGGTTKKGMDCSGLIYTAFTKEDIQLPRITYDMAKTGNWVDIKKVQEGDLLFFATKKNNRKVNHVGLVTYSNVGTVEFIHATTTNGVITSSLAERYWYFAFVQARRIL